LRIFGAGIWASLRSHEKCIEGGPLRGFPLFGLDCYAFIEESDCLKPL